MPWQSRRRVLAALPALFCAAGTSLARALADWPSLALD